MHSLPWLQIDAGQMTADGRPVRLRGFNLGNHLLLEHFMLGLPSVEREMRRSLARAMGPGRAAHFFRRYEETFLAPEDFAYIRKLGANLVRLPFNYCHLEDDQRPGTLIEAGFEKIDRVVAMAREHGLWVLLDMHAAPGAQDLSYNADNRTGHALLWEEADNRRRTIALWSAIARRYRDEPAVMGYDPLNEPCPKDGAALSAFYRECVAAIRAEDPRHIITLESDRWAKQPSSLAPDLFDDPQVMPQAHYYCQFDIPLGRMTAYPQTIDGVEIGRDRIRKGILEISNHGIDRPVLMGEFGMRRRQNLAPQVYRDVISVFDELGYHWTWWSYKDVGAMGLVSPREDTAWCRWLAAPEFTRMRDALNEMFHVSFEWGGESQGTLVRRMLDLLPGADADDVLWRVSIAKRPLEVLLLDACARSLAQMDDAALDACATSFALARCRLDPETEALLSRALAP